MVSEIPLTKGQIALVDDEDYDELSAYSWRAAKVNRKHHSPMYYAMRGTQGVGDGVVMLHRQVLRAPLGFDVDHINGDPLDNRRVNLRLCSMSQNQANRSAMVPNKTSRYRGVCWDKKSGRWQADIKVQQKSIYLGQYEREEDAAAAYNRAAEKHFGEFARLNEIAA